MFEPAAAEVRVSASSVAWCWKSQALSASMPVAKLADGGQPLLVGGAGRNGLGEQALRVEVQRLAAGH